MNHLKSFHSYNESILGNLFNRLFKKIPGKDISHTLPTSIYKPTFNKDRYNISDEQMLEIKDMFVDIADEYDEN